MVFHWAGGPESRDHYSCSLNLAIKYNSTVRVSFERETKMLKRLCNVALGWMKHTHGNVWVDAGQEAWRCFNGNTGYLNSGMSTFIGLLDKEGCCRDNCLKVIYPVCGCVVTALLTLQCKNVRKELSFTPAMLLRDRKLDSWGFPYKHFTSHSIYTKAPAVLNVIVKRHHNETIVCFCIQVLCFRQTPDRIIKNKR